MFGAKTRGRDVEWGRRLVLVDPDASLMGELARDLARKGMEVRSVSNTEAALAAIKELEPPLVLLGASELDQAQKGSSAQESVADFCWRVKERFPFVQFVLVIDDQLVDGSLPSGTQILCRPPRLKILFSAVRAAILQNDLLLDNDRLRDLANRQGLELTQTRNDIRKEISRRRNAIVASKDRWEGAFDALPYPFVIIEQNGVLRASNQAYAALAGEEANALVGAVCHEALFRRSTPCLGCPLANVDQRREGARFELTGSGAERNFMATVYPFDEDEWVCIYREVSAERSETDRARKLAIMGAVGQLSAGVAHELNNPLGAILALVQVMIRDAKLDEEDLEDLRVVEAAADRCRRIVAALLRFARGKTHGPPEHFAVEPVVQDALIVVRGELKAASAVEEVEIAPDLPTLHGSPVGLQRALVALVSNSCDALRNAEPGTMGVITIRVFAHGDEVWIEIADNGPGLPEHMRDGAFTPLVTSSNNAVGAGFGLADVYRIVENFGGAVALLSGPEGGTTARVMIPGGANSIAAPPAQTAVLVGFEEEPSPDEDLS